MKAIAVWTLMAAVMIVSQPSYAFGDLLFHGILMKSMEHENMPDAAPKPSALPWDRNLEVTLPLDVNEVRCSPETYIAAAQAQLTGDQLTALDKYCRGRGKKQHLVLAPASASIGAPGFAVSVSACKLVTSPKAPDARHFTNEDGIWVHKNCKIVDVAEPTVDSTACIGARSFGVDRLGHNQDELSQALNMADHECHEALDRAMYRLYAEAMSTKVAETCMLWTKGMGRPPQGFVPYKDGHAHPDCIPRTEPSIRAGCAGSIPPTNGNIPHGYVLVNGAVYPEFCVRS